MATVRPGLVLPGSLGGLLGHMFRYYEAILSVRSSFDPRHPLASIDRILMGLNATAAEDSSLAKQNGTTFLGWVLVSILVISQWGLLFVNFHPI